QGIRLLRETLGEDILWDFFVLKLLVGLKFSVGTGDLKGRLMGYSKSVLKILERKSKESAYFEASEIGCFALTMALDPSQLPTHHSLFIVLLRGFDLPATLSALPCSHPIAPGTSRGGETLEISDQSGQRFNSRRNGPTN
ncbi:MAG: hypothetical protein J0651_05410, partial [Actinobacteria bacterium]|nr:hypothetical protein [Actinomycetota bacterium]